MIRRNEKVTAHGEIISPRMRTAPLPPSLRPAHSLLFIPCAISGGDEPESLRVEMSIEELVSVARKLCLGDKGYPVTRGDGAIIKDVTNSIAWNARAALELARLRKAAAVAVKAAECDYAASKRVAERRRQARSRRVCRSLALQREMLSQLCPRRLLDSNGQMKELEVCEQDYEACAAATARAARGRCMTRCVQVATRTKTRCSSPGGGG